jgi:hypothetical protein
MNHMTTRHSGRHHTFNGTIAVLMVNDKTCRRMMRLLNSLNHSPVIIFNPSMDDPDLLVVRLQNSIGSS